MKRLVVTGLSLSALSLFSVNADIVYGEEAVENLLTHESEEEIVKEHTYLEQKLSFSISESNQIVIEGTLEEAYTLTLQFSNEPVTLTGSFTVMVPAHIDEFLTLSLLNHSMELVETMTVDTEELYQSLNQESTVSHDELEEVQADELISVDEVLEDFDESRYHEVNELLTGEQLEPADELGLMTFSSEEAPQRTHKNGLYTVALGDTFSAIALDFGISQMQLRVWNPHIVDRNIIVVGQQLAVTRTGHEQLLSSEEKEKLHTQNNPSQFDSVHEFIDYFAPLAIKVSNQPGQEALYPSLMLAQAIHETGVERSVGMSQLARPPYHNLSGIKARGNVPSVLMWTWESLTDTYNEVKDSDKIAVDVLDYFQTFPSYEAALQRYANLLRTGRGTGEDFYYRGTWRSNTKDVWEVLDEGGLRGYATDPSYFNAVRSKIETYDLTRFDKTSRLSGDNRFETAVEISRDGWQTAETVIITNGFEFADALAGSPLAATLDAPILLTRTNSISEDTLNEINRLGATKAIILGGEVAVSNDVSNTLVSSGLITERIGGDNRYETAALIADRMSELTEITEAVLVSGQDFADAMSIAPFAAKEGMPIYLTRTRALANEVKEASSEIKNWTIIGGSSAVSGTAGRDLQKRVESIERIEGANRYQTNQRVINHFGNDTLETYVATGTDFADALTGSVLAAKNDTQVMLIRNNEQIISSQIRYSLNKGYGHFILLGGEVALPSRISESLSSLRFTP